MDVTTFSSGLLVHGGQVLTGLAVVIAVVAVFASRSETRRQRAIQKETLRHGLDGQSIAWGNACIDTLSRAAMFARTRQHQQSDETFLQQRVNLMLALTSLIERGRLLFPNVEANGRGALKEGVYRGSLPPVLEALRLASFEVDALSRTNGPTADNSGDFLHDCGRLLMSELVAYLEPSRRALVVERYDRQPDDQRRDARERAETLRTMLKTRRPGLNIEGRKETVQ